MPYTSIENLHKNYIVKCQLITTFLDDNSSTYYEIIYVIIQFSMCDGGQQLDNDLRDLFQPEPFNGFSMCFMYQNKGRDCKANIFLHIFASLDSSVEILLFSLEGRTKHLMPCIQAFLFSCRKCSHSDKSGFNLQAWHRMKFHRVIQFHAFLNLEPDFSVATASCHAGQT